MMNVSGAAAERRIGRTLMPFMHACFSIGTVAGALVGAGAAALAIPTWLHLSAMGAVIAVTAAIAVRFVPDRVQDPAAEASVSPAGAGAPAARVGALTRVGRAALERLTVWRDLTLVLIGVVMLGMALAEGAANDWIALASIDGHGASKAQGALVLDVFMVAMTLGRMAGGPVVDRIGRVAALRITAGLAVVGLLLFILAATRCCSWRGSCSGASAPPSASRSACLPRPTTNATPRSAWPPSR
jgi:fucose permease